VFGVSEVSELIVESVVIGRFWGIKQKKETGNLLHKCAISTHLNTSVV